MKTFREIIEEKEKQKLLTKIRKPRKPKKNKEIIKEKIMEKLKEINHPISIYELFKQFGNQSKFSYGNIYFHVYLLKDEGKITLKEIKREYQKVIELNKNMINNEEKGEENDTKI